jgi:diketogulonate reductase-like aldo/keto reductase
MTMETAPQSLTLSTGAKMPVLGLGTWKSPTDKAGKAVEYALAEAGYCHIDGAAIYRNEEEIGATYKKIFGQNIRKREDIFITSKLWNTEHRRTAVRKACENTLKDLQLEYLDLYLMHWGIATMPSDVPAMNAKGRWNERLDANGFLMTEAVPVRETWEAMEELVGLGLVKAIGVANFTAPMLVDLLTYAKIPPAVNQIELHPYLQQQELVDFCAYKKIVVTSYSPLGSPENYKVESGPMLLEDPTINAIAKSHGKSAAQVLIRWAIQRNTVVIPKSVTPGRMKENIDVFNFALTEAQMKTIAGLNRNIHFVNPSGWWKIPYF